MESAFLTFATTVGAGMTGYTPTPPPAPVGFAAHFSAPHPESHAEAAASIAPLIDTWLRTGTATPLPSGTPIPWS
jgi:hypothetical protein